MAEVKITYETLFDLLRREKGRNELQVLDESFYGDVISYLNEKMSGLGSDSKKNVFVGSEHEKVRIQVRNIHKILRELYELREKKIITLAMNKVKTDSNLIDTSSMLPQEKSFFEDTCDLLKKYKCNILDSLLRLEMPLVDLNHKNFGGSSNSSDSSVSNTRNVSIVKNDVDSSVDDSERVESENNSDESDDSHNVKESDDKNVKYSDLVKVRILSGLPKFLGFDKTIHGPFSKGDIVELPVRVSDLLISKIKAERV